MSLGEDTITLVRQSLRSIQIPGIITILLACWRSIALDQDEKVRNFQLRSNTFAFLLISKAGTGNLITKKNSEHFGLNEGPSRVYG